MFAGGVNNQNLRFLGQPASFPPGSIPEQFQPYFDQGGGGAYVVGDVPADPRCAARVDTRAERHRIHSHGKKCRRHSKQRCRKRR